jgi:hypothetical protein
MALWVWVPCNAVPEMRALRAAAHRVVKSCLKGIVNLTSGDCRFSNSRAFRLENLARKRH